MIEELEKAVIEWAKEKGIIDNSDPISQIEKTEEEFNELYWGVIGNDRPEIIDGIGDVMVTLIIQSHMQGLTLEECLLHSYNIISKRTGRMENGVFVKNEQ